MNRKLSWSALGLLGLLGLSNVTKCVDVNENVSSGCLEEIVEIEKPQVTSIEADVERLNQIDSGYRLTEEELVFLSRILYFEEGTFIEENKQGLTKDDIHEGYEAIASVLLNRYEFDTKNNSHKFHRKKSNGSLITYAKFPYAFSCIKDRKNFFNPETFKDDQGNMVLKHGLMDSESIEGAYKALVNVLSGEAEDPTNGALFYKTKKIGNEGVVWHGTEAFWLNRKPCKREWSNDITNHQYYHVNCGVE